MERPPDDGRPAARRPTTSPATRARRAATTPTATARSTRSRVSVNGKDRCYGEDTDHDGKIDTWDVMDESGNLTRRAHDSNGDGRVDQAWTFDPTRHGCATIAPDRDGDGKPDPGSPIDICQGLRRPRRPARPPLPPGK